MKINGIEYNIDKFSAIACDYDENSEYAGVDILDKLEDIRERREESYGKDYYEQY